jgi:CheY-like chemotaxis protein
VTAAANGDEALGLLASEAFDVVLLDVAMPGLSGYDVCRRIRQDARTRDLPVVFLTARSRGQDVAEAAEAGSDMYLIKPVLATKLLGMLDRALSGEPRKSR